MKLSEGLRDLARAFSDFSIRLFELANELDGYEADQGREESARARMTSRQQEAFDFICAYYAEHGETPAASKVAAQLGIKHAHRYLHILPEPIRRTPIPAEPEEMSPLTPRVP